MRAPEAGAPDAARVERWLRGLQERIARALATEDGGSFHVDAWTRPEGAGMRGGGDTRVLEEGAVLERAGVNFSQVHGDRLPPAASKQRPELAGRRWQALGVSVVVHPRNPYAPTAHCNVRFFVAETDGAPAAWWFGGGFDLTPYYGFEEDARHWHATARAACVPFGEGTYPKLKRACDEYFFLPHRGEPRGIGGLFFDDWTEGGFDRSFAFAQAVGDAFLAAYLPILRRRKATPHGERQRQWQLYRRGRYVEFNLVHDRGTLFGLQSGGRTESILVSMPPQVAWRYQGAPEAGSAEAELAAFLKPREWV